MSIRYQFCFMLCPERTSYKVICQCRRPQFNSWVGKIHWRRDRLPTPVFLGFPGDSAGKESACNAGDLGLIPGLGRSWRSERLPTLVFCPGEFHGLSSLWGHKQSDTTEWVSLSLSWHILKIFLEYVILKVKVKSLSRVWLFATPWTVAHQAPPSMGFSRQEYWSGLPCNFEGSLFKVIAEFGFSEIYLWDWAGVKCFLFFLLKLGYCL